MFNIDGTANEAGEISEAVVAVLHIGTHAERAVLAVTQLGKQDLILGHSWLKEHNPKIDWMTGKVHMTRCPKQCRGCKEEQKQINACRTGETPQLPEGTEEDTEEEEDTDGAPEEGDRVFFVAVPLEAEFIR